MKKKGIQFGHGKEDFSADHTPAHDISQFERKVQESRLVRDKFTQTKTSMSQTDADVLEQENALLTDKLTGLTSWLAFERRLKFEINRARRYKRPLALLLLTLDGLDQIGREFGELYIADCLAAVSQLVKSVIRDVDIAGVTDEGPIAILLPETYSSRATTVGERLRSKVKKETIAAKLRGLRVTASIGIVSFPTHGRDQRALFSKAFQYLAQAQNSGGDAVVSSDS